MVQPEIGWPRCLSCLGVGLWALLSSPDVCGRFDDTGVSADMFSPCSFILSAFLRLTIFVLSAFIRINIYILFAFIHLTIFVLSAFLRISIYILFAFIRLTIFVVSAFIRINMYICLHRYFHSYSSIFPFFFFLYASFSILSTFIHINIYIYLHSYTSIFTFICIHTHHYFPSVGRRTYRCFRSVCFLSHVTLHMLLCSGCLVLKGHCVPVVSTVCSHWYSCLCFLF
jgi:hypothetical protein